MTPIHDMCAEDCTTLGRNLANLNLKPNP